MFCVQRRNSRWPPKVAGKHYLRKVTSRFWSCPAGQKFRRNRSISLCYLDKHIFAFNAEIQDGRQKSVGENDFCKVASRLCRHLVGQKFCRNPCISIHYRDKHVFAFNAEIQDGCQKWRENHFCEKLPVDFADTLWVKNFVKSRSHHDVTLLHFPTNVPTKYLTPHGF